MSPTQTPKDNKDAGSIAQQTRRYCNGDCRDTKGNKTAILHYRCEVQIEGCRGGAHAEVYIDKPFGKNRYTQKTQNAISKR